MFAAIGKFIAGFFKVIALSVGYLLHIVAELAQNKFVLIPSLGILGIMVISKLLIDAGED